MGATVIIEGEPLFPPIVYKCAQVPKHLCAVLSLNPFIPFVVAYQDVLLYNTPLTWAAFTGILGVGACALLGGLLVFSHFR
jgi:ABC-type polysaccharide/polyol phosphate export permease